jgi:predicted GNAT superfamily acetyltransferase
MSASYTIRPFQTIEEYKACVDLQEETWGHGFSERVSPAILKVSQMLGGVAAGAYDAQGTLVGFVYGMTGVKDGEVVHWSDMLAVKRGLRDTGLGRRLKAHQRRVLLERGITTMFWTFDPLQSRNAHLNFSRLGILVREYARDMYGQTDSPLHRGIGTDRFIALWLMDSERVRQRVEEEARGPLDADEQAAPLVLTAQTDGPLPVPGPRDLSVDEPRVRVAIPGDISRVMASSLDTAVAWREATREVLTHYMARGYEVRELLRAGATSNYLLVRDPGH